MDTVNGDTVGADRSRTKEGSVMTPEASPDRAAFPTAEAAQYVGLAGTTLKKWRVTGDGPSDVKAGSRIVYRIKDLDAWLLANRVK